MISSVPVFCCLIQNSGPSGPTRNVLRPDADHIAAALSRFQQQREGEPRFGADRIVRLELRDLLLRESVTAVRLVRRQFDALRRVVNAKALCGRELKKVT